jgi:hypothetical protein
MNAIQKAATFVLGAGVLALPLTLAAAPPKITTVTGGTDAVTGPFQQSETAYNISQLGGGVRVETIAYNDKTGEVPSFVFYDNMGHRKIFPGVSLMGWSFRTRTPTNPDPPWTHAKVRPPAGTAGLWGDPSIATNPDLQNVVLMGGLAIPSSKFPASGSIDDSQGACDSFGGGCVARSTDGGVSFSMVNCFGDTSDTGQVCPAPFEKTKGHFYDGSAVAVTKSGSTFSGFAAFIDTDTGKEAVWKMADVTGAPPAQQFVQEALKTGTMGNNGGPDTGDVGPVDTHLRLIADGPDLWKMSRDDADLKVNIHGQNRAFKVLASNAHTPFSVRFGTDGFGEVWVRTGPQFAFDIGVNEAGQKEMRFVYVASENGLAFMQAGFCTMDLSDCQRPVEWRLPAFGSVGEFHPAIKFGKTDNATGKGVWRISFLGVTSSTGATPFWADLVRRDLVPTTTTNTTKDGLVIHGILPTALVPCPTTTTDGYWGDYDGMAFDTTTQTFARAFSDSTLGCVTRDFWNALNIHVTAAEIPTRTKVAITGTIDTTDQENIGSNETSHVNINDSCSVDADHPTDNHFSIHPCTGDEVVVILKVSCTLAANDAVDVHVHSELLEGDGCGTDQEVEDTEDQDRTVASGGSAPQVAIDLTHDCFNCGDHAEIRLNLSSTF